MFGLIKKIFIGLLTGTVNRSNYTKCVSFSNQIEPTFIYLHFNEYSQEFHYYLFVFKLDKCFGSYNPLNDLPNKVCVSNKAEDFNVSVFNMITRINELKTLTKHSSRECKCRFDGRKCNSDQRWNNDNC